MPATDSVIPTAPSTLEAIDFSDLMLPSTFCSEA